MQNPAVLEATIRAEKLIAILRRIPQERLLDTAEALFQGGVRILECTFDHSDPDCLSALPRQLDRLRNRLEGRMVIGAGTVLTPRQVELAHQAGAQLIISPNTDRAVIARTRELDMVSVPGALTASEVVSAWDAGAHFVKLFPAGELGLSYVKALCAPLSHIPLLAVGGVTRDNAGSFLRAGVLGFGVGSQLVPSEAVAQGDYGQITRRAAGFVDALSI